LESFLDTTLPVEPQC